MPSRSNLARSMNSNNVSNSASVSPGKPTMNVVRSPTPGIPARSLSINRSMWVRDVSRRIR
jgi:hypothetical protein